MNPSIFTLDEAPQHLHSAKLAEALTKILSKDRPNYDFGCGDGYYLAALEEAGMQTLGFEGTPGMTQISISKNIVQCDLSEPLCLPLVPGNCICIEVAEHVDEEQERVFLDNVTKFCSRALVLSWAVPGQTGRRHVNCRSNDYVIETIGARGFRLAQDVTTWLRAIAMPDADYFANTLLVFTRESKP